MTNTELYPCLQFMFPLPISSMYRYCLMIYRKLLEKFLVVTCISNYLSLVRYLDDRRHGGERGDTFPHWSGVSLPTTLEMTPTVNVNVQDTGHLASSGPFVSYLANIVRGRRGYFILVWKGAIVLPCISSLID